MAESRLWAVLGVTMCVSGFALIPVLSERAAAVEPATPAATDTRQARAAAETWLRGVDSGAYEASWDQAAELFQRAVERDVWAQKLAAVRAPLGALETRRMTSAQAHSSLPGVPDGRYVVMEFAATYEHKRRAVETVTTFLEPDQAWRVAGYFIR